MTTQRRTRILAPSLLAADFTKIGEQLDQLSQAGVTHLHVDVMDGHFVPNISFGMPVMESIKKTSDLIFDVHLMIDRPFDYIEAIVDAGADIVTFHVENGNVEATIDKIKSFHGVKAGLAIKPGTAVSEIIPYVGLVDMVLVMSVEPGFGGQAFMPEMLKRAAEIKAYLDANELDIDIEMDGGITLDNVEFVLDSGVNVVVAGSSVFKAPDIKKPVEVFLKYMK